MRRDILRRPRSVRCMVIGGVIAGLLTFGLLVIFGVPHWRSDYAALVINLASVVASLLGVAAGAKVAIATARPMPPLRLQNH